MKKLSLLFGMLGGLMCAQTFEVVPVLENGPRDKRINLVIMGDGYTSSQQATFTQDVANIANYLFSKAPYTNYKNYFNVYAIKVISAESGVKHPGTASDVAEPVIPISNPNNYLGTSYDVGGTHRCVYGNVNKTSQTLATNFPDYDMALIVGNDTEYGGCGGAFAFLSRHNQAPDVAVHELGHSFGKLADEYWFSGSGESPNKTKNNDPTTIKWKNWLGTNNVGIYPYTESPTWFRPHQNCEMRYLNQQFCSVCKETLIEKIHATQNPVESYTPANTGTIGAEEQMNFNVNLILPIPNTLAASWKLNGTAVGTNSGTLIINKNQLQIGNNQLTFNVVDNTTDVRVDNHSATHLTSITWTINRTNLGVSNVGSQIYDFVVYPNPTNDYLQIGSKQKNLGELSAVITDMSGRVISKLKLKESDNYKVDMKYLARATYVVSVYKDASLLFTKQVIKE